LNAIGFEGFDQVRFQGSIGVSKGGLSTSYLCARGAQSNLFWAMRFRRQGC
jgi:hypothetical protein